MELKDLEYLKEMIEFIEENTELKDMDNNIESYCNLMCNSSNIIDMEIDNIKSIK